MTVFTAAYFGDYEKFYELYKKESKEYEKVGDYYELDDKEFLTRCIVRGVTYSFDFAKKLNNSDLALSERICSAISGRFIMSNYLEEELIEPFCIRYPDIPTKRTCISISKKFPFHVAILATLMNWEDVYNFLDIKYHNYIYSLAFIINREFVIKDQLRKNNYIYPDISYNSLKKCIDVYYKDYFYEENLKDYCNYDYYDLDSVEEWDTGQMGWYNLSEVSFEGNYILDNMKTYKFKQIKDYSIKDYAS